MLDEELLFEPVHALSRRIRGRKVKPVALTEMCLARIERLNPSLHAFVTVTAERALREAVQAEKEVSEGLFRGPLHGIPYAVQDLFAVADCPTTWGARPYARQIFHEDAAVVRKMRRAGAVLIGTCAMTEIGGRSTADPRHCCRTPWDLARWCGGSSSGPGASVAAGLVAFALGIETWDSIMEPASFCGVTGLRPAFGRISRTGAMAFAWTMDKVGLFCRDAKDAATIFESLLGRDSGDLSTVSLPFRPVLTKARERLVGKRIGIVQEHERAGNPEAERALQNAARLFLSLDAHVESVALPGYPYAAVASTIIAAEGASAFEALAGSAAIDEIGDPELRGAIIGGQRIAAVDYLRCQRLRSLMARDFAQLFQRYDIVLSPSTPACAPPVAAPLSDVFPGGTVQGAAENLLGLPAVSVPCGFNAGRLPIGLRIAGRTFAEAEILEAAHAYQTLTDWHLQRPEL